MSLLFRLLQWVPDIQRLEAERDTLRSEQNSIKLKLRAASAEMGVLEEQLRVLQAERDSQAARLKAANTASEALTKERDGLLQERRALIAQNEAARVERERTAALPEVRRQKAGPG